MMSTVVALMAAAGFSMIATPEKAEHFCLAHNIYREAVIAREPEVGALQVGQVTLARSKDGRWGKTICETVYKRYTFKKALRIKRKKKTVTVVRTKVICDFSWTCVSKFRGHPKNEEKWKLAQRVADDLLAGAYEPGEYFEQALYYLNPADSARKNICWFETTKVPIGYVHPESRHQFYREPADEAEAQALKKKDVPECKEPVRVAQKN